ncbi:MAG: hypothetical protein R3C14_29210 [Caldilineaceae bacterium]
MTNVTRTELEALSKEELIDRLLTEQRRRRQQQRRLVLTGFVLALLVVGLFSFRAVTRWRTRPTYEPIQGWMNIPHIARAYDVPPRVLAEALGLPPDHPDRRPIEVIAKEQDRDLDLVIALLNDAIRKATPPDRRPPPAGTTTTVLNPSSTQTPTP